MRILAPSFAVAALTLLFSECAKSADWEQEAGKAISCYNDVGRVLELQPLERKLASAQPTLDQLADETVPTPNEVALIRLRSDRTEICRNLMLAAVRQYHPYLAPALEFRDFKLKLVYVQLIQQRITYGNANRLLSEAWLEFKAREADYFRAQSDADRRAIAESLNRQKVQSPTLPAGTGRMRCSWVGPTLYCDPY